VIVTAPYLEAQEDSAKRHNIAQRIGFILEFMLRKLDIVRVTLASSYHNSISEMFWCLFSYRLVVGIKKSVNPVLQ